MDKISIVLLHEHPEYLNACSDLLNKQWKRSFSARAQSLEKSFKNLPDSLLLLEETESERKVIGHSRLTRVLEDENGCWIGSVVIDEGKRKKGYGKYLMVKTEEYAHTLNFSTAYLNTHDQQGFYEHLGYTYCEPVSSISFKCIGLMKMNMIQLASSESKQNCQAMMEPCQKTRNNSSPPPYNSCPPSSVPPAPPPPPSLPINTTINSNLGQYWMKKSL